MFLHSSHPDVANNPVRVNILSDGRLTQEVVLMDHQWKKVFLHHDLLKGSSMLTFKINRTWNPKLRGLSEDYRDLGVCCCYS